MCLLGYVHTMTHMGKRKDNPKNLAVCFYYIDFRELRTA